MSKKRKKTSWKKQRLKKIARFHAIVSVSLFALYVALSSIYSPEFLFADIKNKFSALADEFLTVTARVLAPPVQPIVTGTAVCANGQLSITLDWAEDENSETFDIERDSSTLITGLAQSGYSDTNIVVNTSYSYVVTARGPMGPGFATSTPVEVNTPEECLVPIPPPTVEVNSLFSQTLKKENGLPTSEEKRPLFSGTTNIPNGAILIMTVHSSQVITDQTTANANGYWSWRPPVDLEEGRHTLYVTATDPLDSSRSASFAFEFFIRYPGGGEEDEASFSHKKVVPPTTAPRPSSPRDNSVAAPQESIPLDFSLRLGQPWVFPGQELPLGLHIDWLQPEYENFPAEIIYQVLDEKEVAVYSLSEQVSLHPGAVIFKNLSLPKRLGDGNYQLRATILLGKWTVSRQAAFEIRPRPILKLGGGFFITYPELLSQLGTASLILLLLLLLWLFLFSREYWLYLHSLRHITEKNLAKIGLVPLKKERRGDK